VNGFPAIFRLAEHSGAKTVPRHRLLGRAMSAPRQVWLRSGFVLAYALLLGCSSGNSGGTSPGEAGAAGAAGGIRGNGGTAGVGASGGQGGMSALGSGGNAGAASGGAGGASAETGGAGAAGQGGTRDGSAGIGGTGAGAAGGVGGSAVAGTGGTAGAAGPFVCNQAMPLTLTREWFEAGFEQDPGIVNSRWQLKAREHGYITEWANPTSDFWNEPIESPCTNGSTNPDHVVLMVLSWTCCTTEAQWETQINAAIANLKTKYPALKRIDLMTIIRGPGNMACKAAPTAGESIVVPASLDAALAAVSTQNPGFVFVAPKWEAPSCAAFQGGGPEYTTAGSTANAKTLAAYFVNLQ
jgi:hypothetical protein